MSVCLGADWKQFRGPNRDGKSTEKGLLKEWPKEGPPLLWSFEGLGQGYASVSVVDGTACSRKRRVTPRHQAGQLDAGCQRQVVGYRLWVGATGE